MKKYISSLLVAFSLVFVGCDDFKFGNSFLEKPLSDEVNIDSVYAHKVYAEQALAQIYHTLPDFQPHVNRLSWGILESLTDLADMTKGGGNGYHKGTISAADPGGGPYQMLYDEDDGAFSATWGIRKAYLFLDNVDRVPDMTDEEKRIRKGEAKAIIAFHYVQMFRYLGGMPWIDRAYSPEDEMKFTRMTVEEMVDKVCTLIDEAAEMLPWEVEAMDDGRMTKAGMMALKVRFLLFAASPLFNSDQPFRAGEASDLHYTWWGNYDKSRWQKALDAGLAFLRENQKHGNSYQLVNTGNPRKDFCTGYFTRYNHEILICSHRYTKWNVSSKAVSQIRYGAGQPTMNYVDMFQMKDGSEFDWNNPVHAKYPFFDADGNMVRDPRLYETVIVNQDKMLGRKAEIYWSGRDAPNRMGGKGNGDWIWNNYAICGIAVRKHTQDLRNDVQNKFYECPLLRLPEVYLSIAEAMNELGKATEKDEFGRDAYDYINLVRSRVEMWGYTKEMVASGENLREAILRERALEFGFEEVRYFDINRWKHKDYLDITRYTLDTWKEPDGSYRHKLTEFFPNKRVWVELWDDRYYLTPLPLAEINKKYGLVQNPGWE